MKHNGCVADIHYSYNVSYKFTEIEELKLTFLFEESKHVDEIKSYSIDMTLDETSIFYSGDSCNLKKTIQDWINSKHSVAFDLAYIDTCKADYDGNVHLSLRKLTELIEPEHRRKVWCMHLDEGFIREEAEALGFNVVVNEF